MDNVFQLCSSMVSSLFCILIVRQKMIIGPMKIIRKSKRPVLGDIDILGAISAIHSRISCTSGGYSDIVSVLVSRGDIITRIISNTPVDASSVIGPLLKIKTSSRTEGIDQMVNNIDIVS